MVGPGGEQVGIVRTDDARKLAYEADLDLVEVAPKAKPPVAKIMDYGKFKYEQAQNCLLYTSPSPRDLSTSRMPSSA